MNLNPLKKDDTADALVKALEDANNADTPVAGAATQVASVPPSPSSDFTVPTGVDESMIASDPQITGENPLLSDAPVQDAAAPISTNQDVSVDPTTVVAAPVQNTDMPAGLSDDADAHLAPQVAQPEPVADVPVEGELGEVKKDALEALRPLIEKLDLEPADKFEKYLMMLRASDDPTLIKPAYEAAVKIEGEKEKAQALLDIINEINYISANK
jgi:hypothetical protein